MSHYLTYHLSGHGARWALNGHYLPAGFNLPLLLDLPKASIVGFLDALPQGSAAEDPLLPPVEHTQEVWACGVTYLRSRDARKAESDVADVYELVYNAERPEIFMKASGWRVMGHGQPFRIRVDSKWNVPEPELTLVINRHGEIVGYTAGNDASSRDIEGENPLYLPQAKVYNGSCVIGPGIILGDADAMTDLPIHLEIARGGTTIFSGDANTNQLKRGLQELTDCLCIELDFPQGVFLMTGTCLVPEDDFSLQIGDAVKISVGDLTLENTVGE